MQETPPLPPGTVFCGDFTILSPIGSGGMASVYEAREEPLGRVVALKVLNSGASEALRARFLAEARTMGALRHPNIAEIRRYGTDAATGLPFLAMERFPGSLADRLTDSRVLPEAEAARIGLALADALAALHGRDPPIVHRDLKPSNVLIAQDGRPVLADFGFAKSLAPDSTALTSPGAGQPGTWLYAAPEQRAGAPPTPAVDWHSLGVLLYRCLSGGFPGQGGELPRDIAAEVSRAWRPLLKALLRKDPAARLAEPDAIRAALSRIRRSCRRRAAMRRFSRAACWFAVSGIVVALATWAATHTTLRSDSPETSAGVFDESPAAASDSFPGKEWTRTYADTLRETLAAAIADPKPDESGRITVHEGEILLSGDLPIGTEPPTIVLDGGKLLFSPGAAALREAVAECENFIATAPDDARKPPDVLPRRTEWLSSPVFVTARGGSIDHADGDIRAYITNGVRRAPGTGAATLDVFGSSEIVIARQALDPGLTVTGAASVADFLPNGRFVGRRWFDDDNPL